MFSQYGKYTHKLTNSYTTPTNLIYQMHNVKKCVMKWDYFSWTIE